MGTHLNGVTALRLSESDARIDTVVGLHPAAILFGGANASATWDPTLILAGSESGDGLLCAAGNTYIQIWASAGSPQSAAFVFDGAAPANFQDPPYEDALGICPSPSPKPFPWIKGLYTAWLSYYLAGEPANVPRIYTDAGDAVEAPDTQDVSARTAPRGLAALPADADGARLTWEARITDTTALQDTRVLRGEGEAGPLVEVASLPLGTAEYADGGLGAGVTYRYSLQYRDRFGRTFQTAEPVSVVGGAPTATGTRTPRPTNTERATATATSEATSTSTAATPSPTTLSVEVRVFAPAVFNQ
jgi:hypothetical protein